MPLIQIEQDNPKLLADVRRMIAASAESVRQSYGQPEPRGASDRITMITIVTTYLRTLAEHELLSYEMCQVLREEWEVARKAALASA